MSVRAEKLVVSANQNRAYYFTCSDRIEMDIGERDPDSATVFLPGVSDDELIAHSVSSHRGAVCSLLQLEKAALLSTFEEMMEAA